MVSYEGVSGEDIFCSCNATIPLLQVHVFYVAVEPAKNKWISIEFHAERKRYQFFSFIFFSFFFQTIDISYVNIIYIERSNVSLLIPPDVRWLYQFAYEFCLRVE